MAASSAPRFRRIRCLLRNSSRDLSLAGQDRAFRPARWNSPIVLACQLEDLCRRSWRSDDPEPARASMLKWSRKATRTRRTPFKVSGHLLKRHYEGIFARAKLRLDHGSLEGISNLMDPVSHREFRLRGAVGFIAAACRSCASLPQPGGRQSGFRKRGLRWNLRWRQRSPPFPKFALGRNPVGFRH